MFKQEKNTNTPSEGSREQNKIAQGTKIVSDLEAKGGFRIDGNVEGTVQTPGKSCDWQRWLYKWNAGM